MIKEFDFQNILIKNKILKFLNNNQYAEYMQSIEWHKIRNEKIKYYIYYEDENCNILWICNLLEKENENGKFLYAPRGPILDYDNKNIIKIFLKEIKKWSIDKGYSELIINPCIDEKILRRFPKDLEYTIRDRIDYPNLLDACKLAIMNIDGNEEELMHKISRSVRRSTKKSYNNNLKSKISNNIDLKNFYKLYIDTSKRHNFQAHNIDYFKRIRKEFSCNLVFIEIWNNDIPIAMSINIIFKDSLIYLYGASSTENMNMLGMYKLHWEAIKYCIDNKISKYNFGGVFCEEGDIENKDFGLYRLKKGYCHNGLIDIVPDIIINFK